MVGLKLTIQRQNKPVSNAIRIRLKAQIHSPVFRNGYWSNFNDGWIRECNNTSDANKPVSTATQTALDLKAIKPATGTGKSN
jgi:hypothetical protein